MSTRSDWRRKGFTPEQIRNIKAAFRLLLQSKLNTTQAVEAIQAQIQSPEVQVLAGFHQDIEPWRHQIGTVLLPETGNFRFLVLEAARSQGIDMVVAAIKEETFPEIEQHAKTVHWMSLGQLGKLIKTFKSEGVDQAVMAGQVKHKQIFSSIVPDLKMIQLLASLARKNTDSLIGAVARVLEDEGIHLIDSTLFLKPLLPEPGVLTKRAPSDEEKTRPRLWLQAGT